MRCRRLLVLPLLLGALRVTPVEATENTSVAVQLSWSATNPSQTNLTTPGELNNLYLHLKSGVTSFKGAELDLKWSPSGDPETGCIAHTGTNFKTSAGTTCTYLNRGTTTPVTTTDEPGELHVSWANSSPDTTCTSGVAVVLAFQFDGCEDATAQFALCSLILLDANNETVEVPAESLGVAATVLGGDVPPPACGEEMQGQAPVLAAIADTSVATVHGLMIWPHGEDPNGGALTWQGENLPPGATVDPESGVFGWNSGDSTEVYSGITLTATNSLGLSASASFTLTVVPDRNTFGLFQAYLAELGLTQLTRNRVLDLKPQWYHRTIFPLHHPGYATLTDYLEQFVDSTVFTAESLGMDVVLNLSTATDSTLMAHWPPAGYADSNWTDAVRTIVHRYDASAVPATYGLRSGVLYWHVEEETYFLQDMTAADYIDEFAATVGAIRGTNNRAKVGLVGFASDPAWAAAWSAGYTHQQPVVPFEGGPIDAGRAAADRTFLEGLLENVTSYDFVDYHSYARSFVQRGEVNWIKSRTPKDIWCFEMGGPHEVDAVISGYHLPGWSLLTHSAFTEALAAEAVANGVKRVAMVFYPPGPGNNDQSTAFNHVCLFQEPNGSSDPIGPVLQKPAYQTYKHLIKNMRKWWHAYDERIPFPGAAYDSQAVFNMQFNWDPTDSVLGLGSVPDTVLQANVMWCDSIVSVLLTFEPRGGYPVIARVDSVATDTMGVGTKYFTPGNDSLVLQLSPRPLMIVSNARFNVRWGSQVVAVSPEENTQAGFSVGWRGAKGGLAWSTPVDCREAQVEMFDVAGRRRAVWKLPGKHHTGVIPAGEMAQSIETNGVYLIRLTQSGHTKASCKAIAIQ